MRKILQTYDLDGSIDHYLWSFDDYSACPTDGCYSELPMESHTYVDPGVYFLNLSAFDNDENFYNQNQTVTVYPSYTEMAKAISKKIKVLSDDEDNEERLRRKKNLTGACARKNAEACYYLGLMFEEEGDTYTKTKLFERSCSLGYQPACGTFAK
ncbi:MAG: hypothetical protein M9962_13905 [Oligoflexia bacterium]|nr:hypothetical protein [Oligoflexia bacterium]